MKAVRQSPYICSVSSIYRGVHRKRRGHYRTLFDHSCSRDNRNEASLMIPHIASTTFGSGLFLKSIPKFTKVDRSSGCCSLRSSWFCFSRWNTGPWLLRNPMSHTCYTRGDNPLSYQSFTSVVTSWPGPIYLLNCTRENAEGLHSCESRSLLFLHSNVLWIGSSCT